MSKPHVIAITGRKGGIGKSTITANLAAELVAMGRSVAILDTDPQQSLKTWAALGDGLLADLVRPADTNSAQAFKYAVKTASEEAERVLIDTPPGFDTPALMAMVAADLVLLPCGPSPLDLMSAGDALEMVQQARAERGGKLPAARFIPSRTIARARLSLDLPESLESLGEKTLPGIGNRSVVAEAALSGLTVREYRHSSKAGAEFEELAKKVEKLLRRI